MKKEDILKSKNIIPSHCKLGRTEIEWFDLYRGVIAVGGLGKMRDLSAWDEIRKKCELNKNFESENVWKSLRDDYIEYLYCYEKQYYPLTERELPRGIRAIVQHKGALDGLFLGDHGDGGGADGGDKGGDQTLNVKEDGDDEDEDIDMEQHKKEQQDTQ